MTDSITRGKGWAASSIDLLGDGPGFRKVRRALDVTAFGVNAIVMPEGFTSRKHFHDTQDELYFVHAGEVEFEFGDGTTQRVGPGGFVHVNASTARSMHNVGSGDAVYVCVGGKGGYVERDGHPVDGE